MAIHYTRSEALLNTWSHAAGILLGAVTGTLLLMMCAGSGNSWAGTGVVLYLAGMLASYIASTVYHAMPERYSRTKERLRKLDHAAIYWHIAGSYSPLTLIALRQEGLWGWGLFVFIWSCALAGTVMSFRRLREHSNIETMCYIGMALACLWHSSRLLTTLVPPPYGGLWPRACSTSQAPCSTASTSAATCTAYSISSSSPAPFATSSPYGTCSCSMCNGDGNITTHNG